MISTDGGSATAPSRSGARPARLASWSGTGLRRTGHGLRRHAVFAVLCALGVALRVLSMVAYQPAIFYIDSLGSYLSALHRLDPTGEDPVGYEILLLKPVLWVGDLFTVVGVQHVLGIAMAVIVYALLVHKGVWRWVAALATVPILLDAYQLQIEQSIMSEPLFLTLLVGGFAVLAWPDRPGWRAALIGGLLLGLSATVRQVGEPTVLPAVLYALLVARGLRRRTLLAGATALGFLVPVGAYAVYYHHWTGHYGISGVGGSALYGRVAQFVDCTGMSMPDYERPLCPTMPPSARPGPDYWGHNAESPSSPVRDHPPAGHSGDKVLRDFSLRAIRHQPLDFAATVGKDAVRVFMWKRTDIAGAGQSPGPGQVAVNRWWFRPYLQVFPPLVTEQSIAQYDREFGNGPPVVVVPVARFLSAYQQDGGYTPGPVLALAILSALLAMSGVTRRARRSGLRLVTAMYLVAGVLVVLVADIPIFSWRYQLPGYALLPTAGALAAAALFRRPNPTSSEPGSRGVQMPDNAPERANETDEAAGRPDETRRPDETADTVVRQALAEFRDRYGAPEFPPVLVVIAAYNEEPTIGPVLDEIPETCLGQRVATLVVTDGCADATAEVARSRGVYVCELATNRGHGVALRVGYRLAREGGAGYIVTTDADGQYDMAELPGLLSPVLAGEADFVVGSRRLGRDETTDPVRRAGVRFFALLASVLSGQHLTDTSSGFRVFRPEVTAEVTQTQVQYQASELLLGAVCRGFRVAERPMTMRKRGAGKSKKGNNAIYALRYCRVVVGTCARERVRNRTRVRTASPPGPATA